MPPRVDYSFVRKIGPSRFPETELDALRRQAVRESHLDSILKESLLDGDHDVESLRRALSNLGDDYVLNSFPSDLFTSTNLLVRSEFLILRQVGQTRREPVPRSLALHAWFVANNARRVSQPWNGARGRFPTSQVRAGV